VNFLRRLSPSRLLLLCCLVVALGISATALASALDSAPRPAPKPLAHAVHDALAAPAPGGVSASIQLTNHLLEGANLAGGEGGEAGQLASSPLLSGAAGRLWIAADGRMRLELQAERGDTQILYDGKTLRAYDASTNTLYRYAIPQHTGSSSGDGADEHETPSVAKIEEAIEHLSEHARVSGAAPDDVAGQPAYTVRVSPKEGGSLLRGTELSWDAVRGVPLRAAVYSSSSSSPVVELAVKDISYGAIDSAVFDFTPPANASVQEIEAPHEGEGSGGGAADEHPKLTVQGHGVSAIAILQGKAKQGSQGAPEGLPKVKIGAAEAGELATSLGTVLTFARSGVRYLLVGSVPASEIEALARGL
jgi:outer membrane lipoprotein-sorting protein